MTPEQAMEGLVAALAPRRQPRKPRYSVECVVKELGADWLTEVDFDLDGDEPSEDAVIVRKVTLDGKEVDFELLSCAAQDEIIHSCQEELA